MDILEIVKKFNITENPISSKPFGCGHINDTYLVTCECGEKYILQRMNNNVFKDIDGLMNNILSVTKYIERKTKNIDECLKVIFTNDNKPYLKCDDGFFRLHNFISSGISIETSPTKEELKASAKGFGMFQGLLDGFDASILVDTIPNFHNTVLRYEAFLEAVEKDVANRAKDVQAEINFYKSRKNYANVIVDLLKSNKILNRVTHNDTKLNNVLIDVKNMRPICVIDLDTVMPGAICYDFGDSIRTGASTGAEDEKDLEKVNFDIERYRAFAESFVGEIKGQLLEKEVETLHFGAILMTYECGMRFLTDYLNGDTYFKTKYTMHNLVRCRTQMKLVEGMEKVEKQMQNIILGAYY